MLHFRLPTGINKFHLLQILLFGLLINVGPQAAVAGNDGHVPGSEFTTTWKTDNPGTSNSTSITIPIGGGLFDVDWDNDGTFDEFGLQNTIGHDYEIAGTYTVRIHGSYAYIRFNGGHSVYCSAQAVLASANMMASDGWTITDGGICLEYTDVVFKDSFEATPDITQTSLLNGSGIDWGGNYPNGNNATCIGETIAAQDCSHGRDVTHDDDSDGRAGFSFTKLDANGNALSASATEWS